LSPESFNVNYAGITGIFANIIEMDKLNAVNPDVIMGVHEDAQWVVVLSMRVLPADYLVYYCGSEWRFSLQPTSHGRMK
jgi:hypothetical protein